jgi:hypothetical protein
MGQFKLPVLRIPLRLSRWLVCTSWFLLAMSVSLMVAMLEAGTHVGGPRQPGDDTVNLVQNYLVSMAASFSDFVVTWPNGTVTNETGSDITWVITWHLSSVAAHPLRPIETEVGPLIIKSSPAKLFNITYALSQVGDLYNRELKWTVGGVRDLNWRDPQPTIVSLTVGSVHMASVDMAGACFLWGVELSLALLVFAGLVFHPCGSPDPTRRRRTERHRRVRLRVFAATTAVASFFGFIFVCWITAKAALVVRQLRRPENAAFLADVRFGGRAIGILWAAWASLVLACGLLALLSLEQRSVEDQVAQDPNTFRLRRAFDAGGHQDDEIEADPPPPYSAERESQALK